MIRREIEAAIAGGDGVLDLSSKGLGPEGAAHLAGSEDLKGLRSLDLGWNEIGPEGVEHLVGSENLKGLTSLDLGANEIGPEGAKSLADSENLKSLMSLDLTGNELGDDGAAHLAGSEHLKGLRLLDLRSNLIGPGGAAHLAGSENLKGLTWLGLGANGIGDEGAAHLAASENLKGLTSLDLGYNGIGPEGVEHLAGSENLKGLTWLDLAANGIGDDGAARLAGSENLKRLKSLDLGWNGIWSTGAAHLAGSESLKGLTSLRLDDNRIGPEGTAHLAGSENLESLTSLGLAGNRIGDKGAAHLADSENLKGLTSLHLGANEIGPEGVEHLVGSDNFKGLTWLDLAANEIGDDGAAHLAGSESLNCLTSLDLDYNEIGPKGAESLLRAVCREPWRTALKTLNLSGNPIGFIAPDRLKDVNAREWVRFADDYFAKRTRPLNEVKLMLLGNGEAGKTHLAKRLFGRGGSATGDPDPRYFNRGEDRTHGARIVTRGFRVGADGVGEVTLRVYDFGGQPHLHSTHRLFLSDRRAVFIVVCEASKTREQNRLDYWLRLVAHEAGPGVPVIVAITKTDERSSVGIMVEFGRRSSDELATELAVATGAHVCAVAPAGGWSERSEDRDRHERELVEFRKVVRNAVAISPGLAEQETDSLLALRDALDRHWADEAHPERRKWLGETRLLNEDWDVCTAYREVAAGRAGPPSVELSVLQSIGVIVARRVEEPRDRDRAAVEPGERRWRIGPPLFNPEWAQGPAYRLIRAESGEHADGVIPGSNLEWMLGTRSGVHEGHAKELWEQLPFNAEDRQQVIELMLNAEVAFKVGDPQAGALPDLLVPDLLPTHPEEQEPPRGSNRTTRPGLLPGTLLRFIGTNYADIAEANGRKLCWRNRAEAVRGGVKVIVASDDDVLHVWTSSKLGNAGAAVGLVVHELERLQPTLSSGKSGRPADQTAAAASIDDWVRSSTVQKLRPAMDAFACAYAAMYSLTECAAGGAQGVVDQIDTLVQSKKWNRLAGLMSVADKRLSPETAKTYERSIRNAMKDAPNGLTVGGLARAWAEIPRTE